MADFGLTSEATSRTLHITIDSKGTPGYRAPELIGFEEHSEFNNKVDIWSLGCILYELAVGEKKFKDDIATFVYKQSGESLIITLGNDFDDTCKDIITNNIRNMLQIDFSLRPSAADLLQEFESNFRSIRVESISTVKIHEILPGNLVSREIVLTSSLDFRLPATHSINIKASILPASEILSGTYSEEINRAIQKCLNTIDREPLNYWLWHDLSRLYAMSNSIGGAIEACKLGIERWSDNISPLMELTNLYAAKGDYKSAIMTGMQLMKGKSVILKLALTESPDVFTTFPNIKMKESLET